MAKAKATLVITPHELQIVRAALQLYAQTMNALCQGKAISYPVTVYDGNPHSCQSWAINILKDIGMK